jgi:hypothetical protein
VTLSRCDLRVFAFIEHVTLGLSVQRVACMAKPILGVAGGDGRDGVGDGAVEGFTGAGHSGAQVGLQLGPGEFDRVHVGRVGGQAALVDPDRLQRTAHDSVSISSAWTMTYRALDERRILWAVGDIVENRPPLSRWHPDHAAAFTALAKRKQ